MQIYYILLVILLLLLIVIVLGVHNEQNLAVRSILGVIQTHTENIKVLLEAQSVEPSPLANPVNINLIPSILLGSVFLSFILMECFYFDFGSIDTCLDSIKALIENKGNSVIRFITESFSVSQESSKETASSLLNVLEGMESNRLKDSSEIIKRLDSIHLNTPVISSTVDKMNGIDLAKLLKDSD